MPGFDMRIVFDRMPPKKRRLLLAGTSGAVVLFLLAGAPYVGWHRLPNEADQVFSYFAENLAEPELCEKIPWAALQRYSVVFGGGGASFARSDCYENVATKIKDPTLCWNVRPLIDLNPLSPGYSALSCWQHVAQGNRSSVTLSPERLIATFSAMGYDADELPQEGVIGPAIRAADVYRSLARDPGIVARVEQALNRPDSLLSLADRGYLAQLAAVSASDPRWCERIPAGLPVATEPIPFRDWCYMTVAFNTMDARVCERMTPAASEEKVIKAKAAGVRPDIAEQLSARANCARIGHWVGPRPHYGPELPQDPAQIERVIVATGMAMPRARDLPPREIAAYYERFLDALRADRPRDARREAARAKLIGRIAVLR
jgi:hypothetical protein